MPKALCSKYQSGSCRYTSRAPYVCNLIYDCKQPHFFYRANTAHTAYLEQLKGSREGIGLSRQQLYELDCLLTPLIQQGQSIAHIYTVHKNEIPCSIKTIYNYIDQGIFTARNIDLPKKVKYKARKKHRKEPAIDYAYREDWTYKDFQTYLSEIGDENVVEMDTVHGNRVSGKVMLTMFFRNSSLMLIFLLEECSQKCVCEVFDHLTELLGFDGFRKSFPVILTDNGGEFKNPLALEKTVSGEQRTKIFYCDPLASWQKARLEKNHEYIRKVIPKGQSLEGYDQTDMATLANHINSTARASLNGRNPFELAQLLNVPELLDGLDLKTIQPDEIILKPQLLK
ncbi:MAG: IS30 family transposase [Hungatella sp.]|nr:IS30 family transposase [Hungatella sp.]